MSDMFSNKTKEAIEKAIGNASEKVCPKVNFENFDPRPEGGSIIRNSHDICRHFFDSEIANMNHQIPENQDLPDLISYAVTRGWLYGYSCAQDEANPVISNQAGNIAKLNQELSDTRNDLTLKTREANKLKAKLEELKSSNPEKRAKHWCLSFFTALGLAIAAVLYVAIDLANMG